MLINQSQEASIAQYVQNIRKMFDINPQIKNLKCTNRSLVLYLSTGEVIEEKFRPFLGKWWNRIYWEDRAVFRHTANQINAAWKEFLQLKNSEIKELEKMMSL